MTPRKPASWMIQVDERIMEWIRENGFASPGILSRERGFDISSGYIRDRCKWLQYAGLLAPVSGRHRSYAKQSFAHTKSGKKLRISDWIRSTDGTGCFSSGYCSSKRFSEVQPKNDKTAIRRLQAMQHRLRTVPCSPERHAPCRVRTPSSYSL